MSSLHLYQHENSSFRFCTKREEAEKILRPHEVVVSKNVNNMVVVLHVAMQLQEYCTSDCHTASHSGLPSGKSHDN